MIVASKTPDGRTIYFNAFTGKQYRPYREPGRAEKHIPNDVIRFLQPKIERITGISRNQTPVNDNDRLSNIPSRIVPAEKPGWLAYFWNLIKQLFNGR